MGEDRGRLAYTGRLVARKKIDRPKYQGSRSRGRMSNVYVGKDWLFTLHYSLFAYNQDYVGIVDDRLEFNNIIYNKITYSDETWVFL